MKNICHNFYRTIIFNASALYKVVISKKENVKTLSLNNCLNLQNIKEGVCICIDNN